MSSDDVIELGSSDEDAEPAPKRSKPRPNAMVCIPRKLHDVTIKPARSSPTSLPKGLIGKGITVRKVSSGKPQTFNKNKINGKPPTQQLKPKITFNPYTDRVKPVPIVNKPSNSNVTIVKPGDFVKNFVPRPNFPLLKAPIRIQNPKTFSLPPSITVKKTVSNRSIVLLNVKGKTEENQNVDVGNDVMTVELDDDEVPAQTGSPQWYLRPEDGEVEEAAENPEFEDENNKEPETTNLIEITIEDSPIKPVQNKRTHEVGAELAITIDDSPVKAVADKINRTDSVTDNEEDASGTNVPQSKKKLEYPKEIEDRRTVEIEIGPVVVSESNVCSVSDKSNDPVYTTPENKAEPENKVGPENKKESENIKEPENKNEPENKKELDAPAPLPPPKEERIVLVIRKPSEFHPVYQSFINLCFQLENSEDMKKIVEKKIKGYYRQVPKEYTESEEFIDMVSSKIIAMKASPEKMFLYIKDIVDELNLQRKLAKSQPVVEHKKEEPVQMCGEETVYDSKRRRQIRKLEKTIKKLHRAIQKLEEQEVDFDDEDDSVYILTERYKERMVRVYAKFCQLSNTKMPSEPRIQIDARPGRPSGPAKRLEKWINKKVPIGTPLPFPDFHDVLRCVREANEEDRLNYNEAEIMEEARDLFTRCGKKLQRRRQENEWRLAASRITIDVDPAEKNEELREKLRENRKLASVKETEIFNKFADKQNQLKLEGEEIGDKEAEESPAESEEEDEAIEESDSLENTRQRKHRLKRLLHEKSKKASGAKGNIISHDTLRNSYTVTLKTIKEDDATQPVPANKQTEAMKEATDVKEKTESTTIDKNAESLKNDENADSAKINEMSVSSKNDESVDSSKKHENAVSTTNDENVMSSKNDGNTESTNITENTKSPKNDGNMELTKNYEENMEAPKVNEHLVSSKIDENPASAKIDANTESANNSAEPSKDDDNTELAMNYENTASQKNHENMETPKYDENAQSPKKFENSATPKIDEKVESFNIEENSMPAQNDVKMEPTNNDQITEPSKNYQNITQIPTETYELSDDSNELESDIDELHLLQKLNSPKSGQSSSGDSSDSDCHIAISDSLDSSDDEKKNNDDDIISIENSSYSENEDSQMENTQTSNADSVQFIDDESSTMPSTSKDTEIAENADVAENVQNDRNVENVKAVENTEMSENGGVADVDELAEAAAAAEENNMQIDISSEEIMAAPTETNNYEYNEADENIVASSEDDNSQGAGSEAVCVNLRDDLISIDETFIGVLNAERSPILDENSSNTVVEILSTKDDNEELMSNDSQSDEPKEIMQTNSDIIAVEMSSECIEEMDVDLEEDGTKELDNDAPDNSVPIT